MIQQRIARLAPQSVALPIFLALLLPLSGCSGGRAPSPAADAPAGTTSIPNTAAPPEQQVAADSLLDSAVQLLQSSKRGPEAHRIAAQRLNQYLAKARSSSSSPVPPLSADIKSALFGRLSPVQLQLIESEQFDQPDSTHIGGCFLLRDVAKQVTAGKKDSMSKALAIFDWVIRNVEIVPLEESAPVPVAPPLILMVGRGNEAERAWTFMELLRQADIECVLLAWLEKTRDGKQATLVPWLPAALWDDSLHLFDTTLGLPVPGPDDRPVATLQEVLAEPSLLNQLSPDSEHPYRLNPEQLKSLLVLLESSPMYWAPRMRFLQENLAGEKHVVLWSDLVGLADHVRRATGDEMPQELWILPRTTHELSFTKEYKEKLRGNRENPVGILTPYVFFPSADARTAHLQGKWAEAIPLYLANRIPYEQWTAVERNQLGLRAVIANAVGPDTSKPEVVQEVAFKLLSSAQSLYNSIREDCTYFLGAAKFEQQDYKASTNWMAKSYLEKYPEGRWTSGARYHLGRCAEAENDIEKAIEYYTMPDSSPQAAGNLVRARRLGSKNGGTVSNEGITAAPDPQ